MSSKSEVVHGYSLSLHKQSTVMSIFFFAPAAKLKQTFTSHFGPAARTAAPSAACSLLQQLRGHRKWFGGNLQANQNHTGVANIAHIWHILQVVQPQLRLRSPFLRPWQGPVQDSVRRTQCRIRSRQLCILGRTQCRIRSTLMRVICFCHDALIGPWLIACVRRFRR